MATPIKSPDFVKLAEAHGLTGLRVTSRDEVIPAIQKARSTRGGVVIDFRVEQEDSVYPMVPAGADLQDMIRRPVTAAPTETKARGGDPERAESPIYETGEDKW